MPDAISPLKFLSLDQNYITYKGVQYEVTFRSTTGQEGRIIDKATLHEIFKILESTIKESDNIDLSTTILTKEGIKADEEEDPVVEFPKTNQELMKKVDNLFKTVHSVVKFDVINFNPRAEFPALKNVGNSCYMDASLEFLISIKGYARKRLKEAEKLNKANPKLFDDRQKKLLEALLKFFNALETRNIEKIRKAQMEVYKNTGFPENVQQDAHEFLIPIFDLLQVKIKTKTTTTGKTQEKAGAKAISADEKSSHRTSSDTFISLGMGLGNNLLDMLKAQYSAHSKDDPNVELRPPEGQNFDDKHIFVNHQSEPKLTVNNGEEPPEVIFVQFTRSNQGELRNVGKTKERALSKNDDPIDFTKNGERLNLSEIFDADTRAKFDGTLDYEITGTINHMGTSLRSGHYIAKVKHEDTGEWFLCNDLGKDKAEKLVPGSQFDSDDQKQVYMIALKRVKPVPVKQP